MYTVEMNEKVRSMQREPESEAEHEESSGTVRLCATWSAAEARRVLVAGKEQ